MLCALEVLHDGNILSGRREMRLTIVEHKASQCLEVIAFEPWLDIEAPRIYLDLRLMLTKFYNSLMVRLFDFEDSEKSQQSAQRLSIVHYISERITVREFSETSNFVVHLVPISHLDIISDRASNRLDVILSEKPSTVTPYIVASATRSSITAETTPVTKNATVDSRAASAGVSGRSALAASVVSQQTAISASKIRSMVGPSSGGGRDCEMGSIFSPRADLPTKPSRLTLSAATHGHLAEDQSPLINAKGPRAWMSDPGNIVDTQDISLSALTDDATSVCSGISAQSCSGSRSAASVRSKPDGETCSVSGTIISGGTDTSSALSATAGNQSGLHSSHASTVSEPSSAVSGRVDRPRASRRESSSTPARGEESVFSCRTGHGESRRATKGGSKEGDCCVSEDKAYVSAAPRASSSASASTAGQEKQTVHTVSSNVQVNKVEQQTPSVPAEKAPAVGKIGPMKRAASLPPLTFANCHNFPAACSDTEGGTPPQLRTDADMAKPGPRRRGSFAGRTCTEGEYLQSDAGISAAASRTVGPLSGSASPYDLRSASPLLSSTVEIRSPKPVRPRPVSRTAFNQSVEVESNESPLTSFRQTLADDDDDDDESVTKESTLYGRRKSRDVYPGVTTGSRSQSPVIDLAGLRVSQLVGGYSSPPLSSMPRSRSSTPSDHNCKERAFFGPSFDLSEGSTRGSSPSCQSTHNDTPRGAYKSQQNSPSRVSNRASPSPSPTTQLKPLVGMSKRSALQSCSACSSGYTSPILGNAHSRSGHSLSSNSSSSPSPPAVLEVAVDNLTRYQVQQQQQMKRGDSCEEVVALTSQAPSNRSRAGRTPSASPPLSPSTILQPLSVKTDVSNNSNSEQSRGCRSAGGPDEYRSPHSNPRIRLTKSDTGFGSPTLVAEGIASFSFGDGSPARNSAIRVGDYTTDSYQGAPTCTTGEIHTDTARGSLENPLLALRLMHPDGGTLDSGKYSTAAICDSDCDSESLGDSDLHDCLSEDDGGGNCSSMFLSVCTPPRDSRTPDKRQQQPVTAGSSAPPSRGPTPPLSKFSASRGLPPRDSTPTAKQQSGQAAVPVLFGVRNRVCAWNPRFDSGRTYALCTSKHLGSGRATLAH